MNRRNFLLGGSALTALAIDLAAAGPAGAQDVPPLDPVAFDPEWLLAEARRLSESEYEAPSTDLPAGLGDLGYDEYRALRFRPEARIWASEKIPFRLDLLHRGFIFKDPVQIALVSAGAATPIPFSPAFFDYGGVIEPPAEAPDLDYSGFRVRAQINTPDVWDEFILFQGASYFRAVGRNQVYGLSARGLAINTASPEGEEFPAFRRFWIERPAAEASELIVHALLDSPSTTGAYRFAISPGAETVVEVTGAIFPRQPIDKVGIAPLTSMFMFDPSNKAGFDDFRAAVHDSNGLQMLTGRGEWLWRPLANPGELQISLFVDDSPRGFGLMQRARDYDDFQDLEARYERRPSLWIEPIGDWGRGYVELVEIPTTNEIHDNIVAYWRPDGAVPDGGPWRFAYRMRWTDRVDPQPGLLVTNATLTGAAGSERRLFVIDFAAVEGVVPQDLALEVQASAGQISEPIIHARQHEGRIRISFRLEPQESQLSELRVRLLAGGSPASETWLYRWTPR